MEDIHEDAKLLQSLIDQSKRIVFFSGAGVSTESGIPDFRSEDGLYRQHYHYPPEEILSHDFFMNHTEEFYQFYRSKMLILDKKPNPCHLYISELEKKGKIEAVITQNIDGLHQQAGSKKVIELHGSIHRNYCMQCGKEFTGEEILKCPDLVPHCPNCGGIIKPDVVLYNESLSEKNITDALEAVIHSDLMIVAGTSLKVYPAASFPDYFRGNHLVLINKDPSVVSLKADVVFHQKVGALFSLLHV